MESFNEIINSDTPVLVDFYADWCGPCRAMEPTIKDVSKAVQGKARVIKVNIDKNAQTAREFNVSAVPTLLLFRKGKLLWRQPGMIDKTNLLSAIAKYTS